MANTFLFGSQGRRAPVSACASTVESSNSSLLVNQTSADPVQRRSVQSERIPTTPEDGERQPAFGHRFAGFAIQPRKTLAAPPVQAGGLPESLRMGIEHLSGVSMAGVRVHYNSQRPAALQALAYTQGTEIHLAPAQERHLPHEAWHVAQQRMGKVRATAQIKGEPLNDAPALEYEADRMGEKAARYPAMNAGPPIRAPLQTLGAPHPQMGIIQRNKIRDIATQKKIGLVGEDHQKYLSGDMGLKYREAEKHACQILGLDYYTEHDLIPISDNSEEKSKEPSKPIVENVANGNRSPVKAPKLEGYIQPDDPLLMLAMYADNRMKGINGWDEILIKHSIVPEVNKIIKDASEYKITGSLLTAEEISNLKAQEESVREVRIDRHMMWQKLELQAAKTAYGNFFENIFKLYKEKVEKNEQLSVITRTLIRVKEGNQNHSANELQDIISAQRSIWMFITVMKNAHKMKPAIYKIGDEHIEDMMNIVRGLSDFLAEGMSQVVLISDREANALFREINPNAYEEIRKEHPSPKRMTSVMAQKAASETKSKLRRGKTMTSMPKFQNSANQTGTPD